MIGLFHHLWLTLKLNYRNPLAIIYGYLVPIVFLLAFGAFFRSDKPPLRHEMGMLLVVTVLGGACFGMPTAMVAERERGVWRRYKLLPAGIGGIIVSAMIARFLIVLGAALVQFGLAWLIYKTPPPLHTGQAFVAFIFVTFAFLGLGLVIAMLADTVPAVQALGQAVFLPMIMIGGVGVPIGYLAPWAQKVASFLPGRYAVEALDACIFGKGLNAANFALLALTIIGLAGMIAGVKMFRWDIGQRLTRPAKAWVGAALLAWVGVGIAAEGFVYAKHPPAHQSSAFVDAVLSQHNTSQPAPVTPATTQQAIATPTQPATNPTETAVEPIAPHEPWFKITQAQVNSITYDDLPDDTGAVAPFAANADSLDNDTKQRLDDLANNLLDWRPGQVADVGQRVRNLLCVCAVPDIAEDLLESYAPGVVLDFMKMNIQRDELIKALAWVALEPNDGTVVTNLKELGFEGDMPEDTVRERTQMYARKFLFRLLGKDKETTQPADSK